MKALFKIIIIIVLAFAYSKIIYGWERLDGFFNSEIFFNVYGVLAGLFNVHGVEEGEFMIILVALFVSLIAAILTVWFLSRFMLEPLYGMARRHIISTRTQNN